MVSRLEIDSHASSMRKLGVGECLVQLNDAQEPAPTSCKVGLPEHAALFNSLPGPEIPGPITVPVASGASRLLLDVAENDSARVIYDRLPPWAREAAKFVHESGGSVSTEAVQRKLDSKKRIKQMVHGRHPLLERRGKDLVLTKLGEKIVVIATAPRASD